jgi:hypothetical protein
MVSVLHLAASTLQLLLAGQYAKQWPIIEVQSRSAADASAYGNAAAAAFTFGHAFCLLRALCCSRGWVAEEYAEVFQQLQVQQVRSCS